VENVWRHAGHVVFKFRGVDSMSDAEKLSGGDVEIPFEERAQLPEGEYFQTDLVGCAVVACDGKEIGIVDGWQEYGGPQLLKVKAGEKEILVPFAKSICVEIDVPGRKIVVDLPEGLLDL
jgi:16S rRNA processing protein RimM